MRRGRPLGRLVAGAGLVLAMCVATAPPALAQAGERIEVEVVGGGPVFDFSQIHPGATLTSALEVTNIGPDPGSLSVSAVDIVDESRCSGAEVRMEMACGSGRGHLGDQVQFSIEHLPAAGGAEPVWTGSIEDLDSVDLAASVAPGDAAAYRFSAHLPSSSGNETQSDLLGFDLRFDLADEDAGSETTDVLGASTDRPQTASVFGVTLPRTGSEVARWGYVAGAVLLVGSLLVLLSEYVRATGGARPGRPSLRLRR